MSKEFDDFMNSVKQLNTCIVKTNHEISDEEIEKAKWEHFSDEYADMWSERVAFKLGAVWYREQLRLKVNNNT